MDIKKRKIELPNKDTMLFISNSIFNLSLKQTLPKRKIYESMLDYYKNGDDLFTLISILSNDAYLKLEKICIDSSNGINPIKSFHENYSEELEDVMIFIAERINYNDDTSDFLYSCDIESINKLNILFSDKGKEIAKEE